MTAAEVSDEDLRVPDDLREQARKMGLFGYAIRRADGSDERWVAVRACAQSNSSAEIAFPVAPRRKAQPGMIFRGEGR